MTKAPHTTLRSRKVIAAVGWTVLSHTPYTADSALSDFQIFGPLKNTLRGSRYAEIEQLKQRVWGATTGKGFYATGIQRLKGGKKPLIMQETLCKNNLNFVKFVPIIYVNLIVSVVIASDKKNNEALLLYRPSYQPGSFLQNFKEFSGFICCCRTLCSDTLCSVS
jgi:hypothetical protein